MPRLEAALVDHLRRTAAVRDLTDGGKRIYRGKAPGDADWPRLHWWMVSDTGGQSVSGGETLNRVAKLRLESLGRGERGYEDARALMDAVQDANGGDTGSIGGLALRRFRGWMAPPPQGNDGTATEQPDRVWIQSVRVDEVQAGDEEQSVDPRAKSIFVVAIDLTVNYLAGPVSENG